MPPFDEFAATVQSLLDGRTELNLKLVGSRSANAARGFAIQGLYLVAVRSFEGFLEDQIFALASGKVRWTSRLRSDGVRLRWSKRLNESRGKVVKSIVLRRRPYIDYLPYERTEEIAELLFHGGRPFTCLDSSQRVLLSRCLKVRNYIAHRSDSSYENFIRAYNAIKPIRLQAPKAVNYLDDEIRSGVTFFEHDISELLTIARFLS